MIFLTRTLNYDLLSRHGSIHQYEEDDIEAAGDVDNGECGIKIRNIDYRNSGTWKCEILRKQRPGSTRLGSEVTNAEFKVDVFRTSRLNDDDSELQVIIKICTNVHRGSGDYSKL